MMYIKGYRIKHVETYHIIQGLQPQQFSEEEAWLSSDLGDTCKVVVMTLEDLDDTCKVTLMTL